MAYDLFKEVIPSLLNSRIPKIASDEEAKTSYPSFVINRAISQHLDCVLFANAMNMNAHLPLKMQHDFYFHGLRKYKRPFSKWAKKDDTKDDLIELIQEKFNYSRRKAIQALRILSKEQLKEIVASMDMGGKT